SEFRGKVVLIFFWMGGNQATASELRHVKRAYTTLRDDGFEIIGVSLDDTVEEAQAFIRLKGMPWHHVAEGGGWDTRLAKDLEVFSVPQMFIVDHEGICVSDSVRGSSLLRVARREVKRIPEDTTTTDDGRGQNPTVVRSLEDRLANTGRQLDDVATPYAELHAKLDTAFDLLDWLSQQYPHPKRTQLIRIRYGTARDLMTEVRQELFVNGYLNDRVIEIPPYPFVDDDSEPDAMQLNVVRDAIAPARRSIEILRLAMSGTWADVQTVRSDLKYINRRLGWSRGDLNELTGKIDEVEQIVGALHTRTRTPWLRQLDEIETVLDGMAGGDESLKVRASIMAEQLAHCRKRLPIATRRASVYVEVRDTYTTMYDDLDAMVAALVDRGTITASDVDMPGNPFKEGVSLDARTRIQVDAVLDRVGTTLDLIRRRLGASTADVEALRSRLAQLRLDVQAARDAGAPLGAVEEDFRTLCDEILTMMDDAR
ncbi:MAG: thioredoxin-like domain-containing protein, partial [Planctomycetota bacterium]